jgi:cellulose synthase/poly-beta-1,6-N-acetylglucosamine synthase-like glycosyltransferase
MHGRLSWLLGTDWQRILNIGKLELVVPWRLLFDIAFLLIELLFACIVASLVIFYLAYCLFGIICGKEIKYKGKGGQLPKVSLIVATYNEENAIGKKIDNIKCLNYPPDLLEVVFVDSSTDGTLKAIRDFKEKSRIGIQVISEKVRKGLATALNTGYSSASGDIVMKSDCDMMLDNYAVKEIVEYFSNPEVGAVSGAIKISNKCNVEIGYRSIFERLRAAESNLDSTYLFNPICAFRKNLVEPVDSRSVADDAELALKIRKKGYRTVYAPEAIAYESSPVTLRERVRQKSRRAQGHIRLIFQNMDILFNRRLGKFGLVIFPANFFMIILSPWLFVLAAVLGLLCVGILFGAVYAAVVSVVLGFLIVLSYVTSRPKMLAGFLDAQVNLIIGLMKLISRGPDYMWSKEHRR